MATITLITGGARSGKSRFAQETAETYPGERLFIATAQPFDREMEVRIAKHREERANRFTTMEAPFDLAAAVRNVSAASRIIVVDCLTVWLGNLLFRYENDEAAIAAAIAEFTESIDNVAIDTLIVTNEVGMGIVPENALARRFRDLSGKLNSTVARRADNVYLCVCGLPMAVKGTLPV